MTAAILCSGQGPQHPGMFSLTSERPEAAKLFAQASALLGEDPRVLVRTATAEAIHRDRTGQILCCLQALTAASSMRGALSVGTVVAGYSAGELAAWGVAGSLTMSDTLDLVAARAETMDAAAAPDQGMLYLRGLSRHDVDRLCAERGVAIAIFNPESAFVLGGDRRVLAALAGEARAMQATRVIELPIAVASHTPKLAKASAAFRRRLDHASVRPVPESMRLLSGIDGAPVLEARAGLDKLAAQISQPVQWADCLQGCVEAGARAFLELGPGSALAKMASDAFPHIPARSLEEFRTLDGAVAWLTKIELT
jgi:[acyl-carrier-protein] S-malonyltransferase